MFGSELSTPTDMRAGAPQGSLFGPELFIYYKCESVRFPQKQKPPPPTPQTLWLEKKLHKARYLGIGLDPRLTPKEHLNEMISKF